MSFGSGTWTILLSTYDRSTLKESWNISLLVDLIGQYTDRLGNLPPNLISSSSEGINYVNLPISSSVSTSILSTVWGWINFLTPLYINQIIELEFTTNSLWSVELNTAPIFSMTVAADVTGRLSLDSVSTIHTQFSTFPGTNMNSRIGLTNMLRAAK